MKLIEDSANKYLAKDRLAINSKNMISLPVLSIYILKQQLEAKKLLCKSV